MQKELGRYLLSVSRKKYKTVRHIKNIYLSLCQLEWSRKKLHAEMISILTKFRDEEQEHHDIGLAEGAENAPAF